MHYPVLQILLGVLATYVVVTISAELIARAGFPVQQSSKRMGCIDGMRGYLAFSVLTAHFIVWLKVDRLGGEWGPTSVHLFDQIGLVGVALFFMTTGFVFYPKVLDGFQACSWTTIYMSRLFRIIPLITLSVVIMTGIIAFRTGHRLDSSFPLAAVEWITTWDEPPLLGYADSGRLNAHVLWSLWYEWMFYLFVLPACALMSDLRRGRLPSWVLPLALVMGALGARALHIPGRMWVYLPLFAIGMLAYECQRREWIARTLRTPMMAIVSAGLLASAMMLASTPFAAAMPIVGLFFICVACGNSMGGIFRTKSALVLGECSYGTYILHGIVLSLLFVDNSFLISEISTEKLPIVLPLVAIVTVFLTPVTYLFIERPSIRLGRRLANWWTGRRLRGYSLELEVAP